MLMSYVDPHTLPGNVVLPRTSLEAPLSRSSPAVEAMTDFSAETPICVSPGRHIDDALPDTIQARVRSLVVVDEGAVLGLITAADILGTRPIQFLQNPLCESHLCRHQDVHVNHYSPA
jgi:signal-transduction protein with cAMP-binding, CBS, and nucleotidyltransferase domain